MLQISKMTVVGDVALCSLVATDRISEGLATSITRTMGNVGQFLPDHSAHHP
jgi:hypothetical protein